MTDYIACELLGPGSPGGIPNFGLGNMMFQIAALYSHALDNGYKCTFPAIKNSVYGNYTKNIFSNVPVEDIDSSEFARINIPFEYNKLLPQPNVIYRGHFQSELYFNHNKDWIRALFEPTAKVYSYIQSKYELLLSTKTVSIHIRRGDYVNLQEHHPLLEPEYYMSAVNYIMGKYDITKYVVFSDDIPWCKELLGNSEDVFYIEGEEDYIDMYLMSMCTHNIIANSSFSWWGAWLNKNPDKIVIAPEKWFGPAKTSDTKDLIPKEWIKI